MKFSRLRKSLGRGCALEFLIDLAGHVGVPLGDAACIVRDETEANIVVADIDVRVVSGGLG